MRRKEYDRKVLAMSNLDTTMRLFLPGAVIAIVDSVMVILVYIITVGNRPYIRLGTRSL